MLIRLRVTTKLLIAIAIIASEDTQKEILKIENNKIKRKIKAKPKKILKFVLVRKSKEEKGSFFFLKKEINFRMPKPTTYRITILTMENRTESHNVIEVHSHHISTLPYFFVFDS